MKTIGDIKIASLKLMFTNYSDKITAKDGYGADNILNLEEDAEYGKYLVNMDEAISRAFFRLSALGALSPKSYTVELFENKSKRIILKEEITDFYALIRVVKETENEYIPDFFYYLEEDGSIFIPKQEESCVLKIIYEPFEGRHENNTETLTTVSDELADIVPYFVKAELLEEEEPDIAAQARNIFESAVADRIKNSYGRQKTVTDVYGGIYD